MSSHLYVTDFSLLQWRSRLWAANLRRVWNFSVKRQNSKKLKKPWLLSPIPYKQLQEKKTNISLFNKLRDFHFFASLTYAFQSLIKLLGKLLLILKVHNNFTYLRNFEQGMPISFGKSLFEKNRNFSICPPIWYVGRAGPLITIIIAVSNDDQTKDKIELQHMQYWRYWPSVGQCRWIFAKFFFAFLFVEVNKMQKRTRPIFSHLDLTLGQ